MMTKILRGSSAHWALGFAALFLAAAAATLVGHEGNIDGAIFTSDVTGTVVNENTRYGGKEEVYLNGGPQNHEANSIPDGYYYYQITDPSGKTLLSNDDITCRVLLTRGGRVYGVPDEGDDAGGFGDPSCYHAEGLLNLENGVIPVQMGSAVTQPQWFLDTPNNGGEYKAWITPVGDFVGEANDSQEVAGTGQPEACRAGDPCHGFVDSHSKTDNFKIREEFPRYADVIVCKFNDLDGNGAQDPGEPYLAHWLIDATGQHQSETLEDGCVTFTYAPSSDHSAEHAVNNYFGDGLLVTLTEVTQDGWTQTAGFNNTVTVNAGDSIHAADFGNHKDDICEQDCQPKPLSVTKTAAPSFTRTFTWDIEKLVNATEFTLVAGDTATLNYTVSVTHDEGTESGFTVVGVITVNNPNVGAIDNVTLSDSLAECTITDNHVGVTIPGGPAETDGGHKDFNYTCAFDARPAGPVRNVASVIVGDTTIESAPAVIDFAAADVHVVDGTVEVTDALADVLPATVSSSDVSPKVFEYSTEVVAPQGTCVQVDNTATFTSTSSPATGNASTSARVCGGVDLTVSKTAAATFASNILKTAVKSQIQQNGGSIVLNYDVTVKTSDWTVSGVITVTNPNDWQPVSGSVVDSLTDAGGACTGGTFEVEASGTADVAYTCTFASAPSAISGTNTATASWDPAAAHTASGAAAGTADYLFGSLTIVDSFNGGAPATLGVIDGNVASTTYGRSYTVSVAPGTCQAFPNTASIVDGASSTASATACNTNTGARTIGFWSTNNGMGILSGAARTGGVCNVGTWLRQFAPFQDLSATAACGAVPKASAKFTSVLTSTVTSYVASVISLANAQGASMNAMLKGQMLGTALDVYFSDPSLGGTATITNLWGIGRANLGGVRIDLLNVCTDLSCTAYEDSSSAFGGSPMTVSQMLTAAAFNSNSGGSLWYGQVKAMQELAKDAFDAINNNLAWIAP